MNDHDWVYLRDCDEPQGRFLRRAEARIRPDDRGFMFADSVYEVIRSYGGRLFKAEEHIARLGHSLAAVRIELPDTAGLPDVCAELLRKNGLTDGDATVYLQVTRGAWPRRLAFPEPPVPPTVYVESGRLAIRADEAERGISAVTLPDLRWGRCDIKWTGLLAGVLARQQAAEVGAAEALFVRDGVVTEGTHTSVFAVRAGTVLTHAAGSRILPGITRATVIDLCSALGIPCGEGETRADDLPQLDELFVACTTGEVLPVVTVDGRAIADGRPGPLTRRLQAAFRDLVRAAARA